METAPASEALQEAAQRALAYVQCVRDRPVTASARALQRLDELKHPLPQTGLDAREVVRRLDEIGSPATIATAGGRYFGLVIGGALPATVAANWLAAAWDQNASFRWTSPIAAALEDVSLQWLGDLFGLPSGVAGAFVTGASMANMAALASARHALLSRLDWDVEAKGLYVCPASWCGFHTAAGLYGDTPDRVQIALAGLKPLPFCWFSRSRLDDRLPLPVLRPTHIPAVTRRRAA